MMYQLGYWYELLAMLVWKEFNVRYKNSLLGYVWSVLNPVMFGLLYFVVFHKIMRIDVENYPLFILCGLFPWQWITTALNNAPSVFLSNATIIRRVAFPRGALPTAMVIMEGIHFLCALPVIVLLMVLSGHLPALCWLWGIPLLWACQSALVAGLSLILATLTPFFRDLNRFTSLGLMALFYVTPVLYSPEMVPARWQWLLRLNPFAVLITAWRDLLMKGQLHFQLVALSALAGLLCLFLGHIILRIFSYSLAEVL